jgi:hypothetical protein
MDRFRNPNRWPYSSDYGVLSKWAVAAAKAQMIEGWSALVHCRIAWLQQGRVGPGALAKPWLDAAYRRSSLAEMTTATEGLHLKPPSGQRDPEQRTTA